VSRCDREHINAHALAITYSGAGRFRHGASMIMRLIGHCITATHESVVIAEVEHMALEDEVDVTVTCSKCRRQSAFPFSQVDQNPHVQCSCGACFRVANLEATRATLRDLAQGWDDPTNPSAKSRAPKSRRAGLGG
jgi:hypothetical protein